MKKISSVSKSSLLVTCYLLFASVAHADNATLPNPLQSAGITSIPDLIGIIIKGLLGISGVAALLFIVWGGFQWLISAGSAEKIKSGRETILWAVLGLGLILISYAVVDAVLKTLGI